jgi:hypothetical protein
MKKRKIQQIVLLVTLALLAKFFIANVSQASLLSPVVYPANDTYLYSPNANPAMTLWTYEREAEFPDEHTVGQTISRSNASEQRVHGQFGTISTPPWSTKAGEVKYLNVEILETEHLYLQIRYSKNSPPSVPIQVYLDQESSPRASIVPQNQGNWNQFTWTDEIDLGAVDSGSHSIKFYTAGQPYGVADLDKFTLTGLPISWAYEREAEFPDQSTVGHMIFRSNASEQRVHGQFGASSNPPWPAQAGEVEYLNIEIPATAHLYLQIRYSKNSPSSVPILVYLDQEFRASFTPQNQGSWNVFNSTNKIDLGAVESGSHSIKFSTTGQQYGVADLDKFTLTLQ